MTAWLSQWLLHPLLFGAGAILVSAPILIHLLNKRRFRIVEWAAMDFLIEAEQRNRRRIQLEEWLLLALRCLLVLLVGLLVARPFLPSSLTRGLFDAARYERIVVLDDSPSMSATSNGTSPFQTAKTQLVEFVKELADRDAGDSITVLLTSRPNWPLLNDRPINGQTMAAVVADLEALQPSDSRCQWDRACGDLRASLERNSDKLNRIVYLVTDLRRSDWIGSNASTRDEPTADSQKKPADANPDAMFEAVRALSRESAGCFVVDVGSDAVANLAVTEITAEDKLLLAGTSTRFNVTVRNHGPQTLRDVPIKFIAGGALPLTASLESVPAGGTASVPFSYAFPAVDDETPPEPLEVKAELVASSATDSLAADNVAFFAARVRAAIPVLVVDGDPSTEFGKSESFFLQRALTPPGNIASGIDAEVVSDSEFELKSLAPYQVVFVCNVYRLSAPRLASLRAWVEAGGGLVVFPSGQVDDKAYDESLYANGEGLLPRRMVTVAGDETAQTFVGFSVAQPDHPAVRVFQGEAAVLLEAAKVFRWWKLDEPSNAADNSRGGTVVMRLSDADRTPALIERAFGKGRVAQFCFGADADWSDWPREPSYVIVLQELARFLARSAGDSSGLLIGEPLRQSIDTNEFRAEAVVTNPKGESVTRQAVLNDSKPSNDAAPQWLVKYDDTQQRGFYKVSLAKPNGTTVPTLFAANLHAADSDLNRVDRSLLETAFEGSNVKVVSSEGLLSLSADRAAGEMWFWVLVVLVALLFAEQFLAWTLGRSR